MKQYLFIALALLVAFFTLSVLLSLAFQDRSPLREEAKKLELRPAVDPERGEVEEVRVPPSRIPSDYEERLQAAAITLLPNHLGAPEARSKSSLSLAEEKIVKQRVGRFLRAWETYLPGQKNWRQGWQNFVVPERQEQIFSRLDSTDAPGICPQGTCQVGSSWAGGDPTVFPVDGDRDHLYLTAYGALRYRGNAAINPYAGGSTERSYGLVLVPRGNTWLIARVAAESLR